MNTCCKALLLDLSGVLYDGTEPIAGGDKIIARAREQGIVLRFITNTATKSRSDILALLKGMGIDIREEELFTAPVAALNYIHQYNLTAWCLVHEAIRDEFAGVTGEKPNCVVLGDARDDITYDALNRAFQLCKDGADLIGIGYNKYFMENGELKLDAGAFIKAIEWAADTRAVIMGKPSADFFAEVVASTGFTADDCLMVGDDVASDVIAANDAGIRACLVKTGKYQPGDENQLGEKAMVIDSIGSLEL